MFGPATFTTNADLDKYPYSRYGVGFDLRSRFLIPNFGCDKNVIIFGIGSS